MKKLLYISILLLSCNKEKFDGAYWNTDRRPQVIRISQRFKDPMEWLNDTTWKAYKVIYDSMNRDIDYRAYIGIKPDTSPISTCSIDKVDSLFRREILIYTIYRR